METMDDDTAAVMIPTADQQRQQRKSKRRSDNINNNTDEMDVNGSGGPWQAMKRLRVDASASSTVHQFTAAIPEDSSDTIMAFSDLTTSYTTNTTDTTSATTGTNDPLTFKKPPPPSSVSSSSLLPNQYRDDDSFYQYQRHQSQESGPDTDGWSSPEQKQQPLYCDRRRTATTRPLHPATTTTNSAMATASVSYDDMDYHNVNFVLGNLHFERQQRNRNTTNVAVPVNSYVTTTSTTESPMSITSSSSFMAVPATPMNHVTRRMIRNQQGEGLLQQQQQHVQSSSLWHSSHNNSTSYQTPPPKPTKRKVIQLRTNTKLA
jgi:hypothetical protein